MQRARNVEEARTDLLERSRELAGTGIVSVATRRRAEDLAVDLAFDQRGARPYHAGIAAQDRHSLHERFLEPEPFIVVATTAFGMGIDAPHVRFVLHADPRSHSTPITRSSAGRAMRTAATATTATPGGVSSPAPRNSRSPSTAE